MVTSSPKNSTSPHHSSHGSRWHKWDLHFHTPSSYDYEDKSVTDESIVEELIRQNIRVVAITDHHTIDVERIRALQNLGGDSLTVLPGIELRSELGSKPIHYIGIFPDDSPLDDLWDTIKGKLELTAKDLRKKGGDEKVYVPLEKAHETFKKLGGIISIHAGVKSNSLEGIENREQFQRRIKYNITRDFVDILEIGQIKDVDSYKDIVFPATGLEKPLIIGSDNHDAKRYRVKTWTWLKADPCFMGLRQVLNEPEIRSFIGEEPPALAWQRENSSRILAGLNLSKNSESSLQEAWFDNVSLELNPGLIAIIGNKGSGKSALTDIIGLAADSAKSAYFSFLTHQQFCRKGENKASSFVAMLSWLNGEQTGPRSLADSVPEGAQERIRYVPQSYLEKVCNEITEGRAGSFDKELNSIILSRLPQSMTHGYDSLSDIIHFRNRQVEIKTAALRNQLPLLNGRLQELESQTGPTHKRQLKEKVKELERELATHRENKPAEVKQPILAANEEGTPSESQVEILNLEQQQQQLEAKIRDAQAGISQYAKLRVHINNIREAQATLRESLEEFYRSIKDDAQELGLDPLKLASLETPTQALDTLEGSYDRSLGEAKEALDPENESSLTAKKARLEGKLKKKRDELSIPERLHKEYLVKLRKWQREQAELIGTPETPGTLEHAKSNLESLKKLPTAIRELHEEQINKAIEIFREQRRLLDVYRELYGPVQEFIDNTPLARDRIGLQFEAAIEPVDFESRFLDFINKGRKGAFHGDSESRALVRSMLEEADFNTEPGVRSFLQGLLSTFRLQEAGSDQWDLSKIGSQLRAGKGSSLAEFYDFILGLSYLRPRFALRWDNKRIEQLSPGERGALLLVFFLLVDDSRDPLIIDQPEENLDNQTVYQLLVECIKEARKRRQIIIVTHNPNLAVVCDADQVIQASIDKSEGNKVTYNSGALENPEIGQAIIDILEGTRPAIDNRISKYKLIFDAQQEEA